MFFEIFAALWLKRRFWTMCVEKLITSKLIRKLNFFVIIKKNILINVEWHLLAVNFVIDKIFNQSFFLFHFFRYIPWEMLLSDLQAPYFNDLKRPPNEKIEKPCGPIKSPQFRPDIVAIQIGPRMKNHETMSPYQMPPIWALFRPSMWPAGPVFLALGPRLCSLFVLGLAVEKFC